MTKKSGFTLLEVVVVLAVISILAVVGAPSVFSWRENVELQGNARIFAADLQMAKMQAVKYNGSVAVNFKHNGYRIFVDDGSGGGVAGDYLLNGMEPVILDRKISEAVMYRHNFSANRMRFSGFGGNKSGTATFSHINGKQIVVVVSVLGRVRIATS